MSDFCTRVELHGAMADDYERLHQAMQRAGFTRVFNGRRLPTAEYWLTSSLSAAQVRDKAIAAASTVKPSYEVVVVQVADWAYHLTTPAKAA